MSSKKQVCDLHVHSTYSDGTLSPRELLELAQNTGLKAIALSDHNTVQGLPEFLEASKAYPVEAIAAVEFSTEYEGTELHIIALFVPASEYGVITDMMEDFRRRKEQSNIDLVEALRGAGIALDYEQLRRNNPDGYINRAHIATMITEKGYTESAQEAFKIYLSPKCGYYKPPKRMDAFEAIAYIRSIGAVSVLAHPFLNLEEPQLEEFLAKAVAAGLDGMETLYGRYDEATTRRSRELAAQYGLLESGGSDFHGANKPDIALGTGRGDLEIPYTFLQALRSRKK